jgi:hypothetical protein
VPVTPKDIAPFDIPAVPDLPSIKGSVDTLTMYVNPQVSSKLLQQILDLGPKRVIFNPGAENPELMEELKKAGIKVIEACTLVLLRTGQY